MKALKLLLQLDASSGHAVVDFVLGLCDDLMSCRWQSTLKTAANVAVRNFSGTIQHRVQTRIAQFLLVCLPHLQCAEKVSTYPVYPALVIPYTP
jgi:hypothetical protein